MSIRSSGILFDRIETNNLKNKIKKYDTCKIQSARSKNFEWFSG